MGNFFKAVQAGLKGMPEGPDGERFVVAGLPVRYAHCRHDKFVEGRAQLNTAGMSFLGLDWANMVDDQRDRKTYWEAMVFNGAWQRRYGFGGGV